MKYLKYLFLFLCSIFWPVSLILNNSTDWVWYLVPGILIFVPLFLFKKPNTKLKIISYFVFFLALIPCLKEISTGSIFVYDPLAYDTQVKKLALIPNRTLGRVVQNKYNIYLDKFTNNVFVNLDINNFFFSFHPRETGHNQDLNKFPYFALPLFLLGLWASFSKRKISIIYPFVVLITLLSLVGNFDKLDFILWPIFIILIFRGTNYFIKKFPRFSFGYFLITIPLVILDFVRIFLLKS